MDSGEVRARQRKARERLCRTAIAYARRFLQSYRDRRRGRTRATATGTVQDAAVCDGSVSFGTGPSVERTWLRNRARREQSAGNQRLQQRVSGGIESPPPADRGTSRKGKPLKEEPGEKTIGQAVAYSREKNLEREAVAEERELLRDALKRSMGDATVAEVKAEFEKRVQAGEFIETSNRAPGRAFTTSEMIDHERNT